MILVNTDYITGKEFEMLGLVKGSTIQSKNVGRDITQGLKTLVGGELKAYNEMMMEARNLATQRMVKEAEAVGADAVVLTLHLLLNKTLRHRHREADAGRGGSSRLWYSSEIHLITGAVRFLRTKSCRNILILSFPALSGRLFSFFVFCYNEKRTN